MPVFLMGLDRTGTLGLSLLGCEGPSRLLQLGLLTCRRPHTNERGFFTPETRGEQEDESPARIEAYSPGILFGTLRGFGKTQVV